MSAKVEKKDPGAVRGREKRRDESFEANSQAPQSGTYGSVRTYISFQFQMNRNEVEICEFEMHLNKLFVRAIIKP